MSKISNNTNMTKQSRKGNATPIDLANHSLENKIKLKLEEMTEKSASDKKIIENLKFYTP